MPSEQIPPGSARHQHYINELAVLAVARSNDLLRLDGWQASWLDRQIGRLASWGMDTYISEREAAKFDEIVAVNDNALRAANDNDVGQERRA